MEKKEDRRVKMTKIFLKESLIDLVCDKDLAKITIKEICERADVNRATFYAHYSDQYALFDSIKDEFVENILKQVPMNAEDERGTLEAILNILNYLLENLKLSKLFLSERADVNFLKRIMGIVYEDVHLKFMKFMKITETRAMFISSYVITGSVGVVQNWFENGLKQAPEEVASIISELTLMVIEAEGLRNN
ncbi:MAG: TetR/AcrR family transcriptional regulator [Vallitaleaceae bacterium]|nr:TetR/AcrR family transcriptional regulator [Vallitaleaceae bacterium]